MQREVPSFRRDRCNPGKSLLRGITEFPMFFPIGFRWHHVGKAGPSAKVGIDSGPKTATHDRVDFRQTLALKLTSNFTPAPIRLRQTARDLGLTREKPLPF
jgi:hypothetical protein